MDAPVAKYKRNQLRTILNIQIEKKAVKNISKHLNRKDISSDISKNPNRTKFN